MTKRRMFSLQIVDTDAFLEMPTSTQALYFHLVMRADDEGFVGNPKKIMKLVGAQDDDMKILISKRFILTFESGIIVIKHWLIHNTIRLDRFQSTTYQEEKKSLKLKENNAYTEKWQPNGNQMATKWQPNGNQMATTGCRNIIESNPIELFRPPAVDQISPDFFTKPLSKKKGEAKMGDGEFDKFWKTYPRREGKGKARNIFLKINKNLLLQILSKVEEKKKCHQWQDPKFIPLPATWLSQERWEDEGLTELAPTLEQEAKQLISQHGEHAMFKFIAKHGIAETRKVYHLFTGFV